MKIANNISELIGNTPLVKLNKVVGESKAEIAVKLEFFNPCSSVKDRIGLAMIEDAERSGKLKKGSVIIEPTSGNTGIALAFVSVVKGYKLILTMPDTMSIERRKLLSALNVQIELTPGNLGMKGAVDRAEELNKEITDSVILQQFNNPANPEIHRKTTANEIWEDTDGKIDIFIAGVGTGGTITGVSEAIKERKSGLKIIAVEPEESAVLSGEDPGQHKIQGIGAGFIPDIMNKDILDEIIKISDDEAYKMCKRLASEEGIICGISSGANVAAAIKVAKREENSGKLIITLLPDTGERYLSLSLY